MGSVGNWIHTFTVTETQTHKNGYTIYKITSVIFPRSLPQTLTCVSVWKRFHEVKRLYKELGRRHKKFQLSGSLPEPTDSSFFKRFDAGVIRRRMEYILQLLDFVAQYPALYKCHAFAQFFNDDGQPPAYFPFHRLQIQQEIQGSIAAICDKLNLHYDPLENCLLDRECDKLYEEHDNQEQDEIAVQREDEQKVSKKSSKDYMRFLTPMASIESDDSDYIYEAALEFSRAVQAEANLEYKDAHLRYKRGVEVLLNGSKDDTNDDRKFIAKMKISKYLARADDIYAKFLREDVIDFNTTNNINFKLFIGVSGATKDISCAYLERPWSHLAKYKVVQVLEERVMQVQCITETYRPVYIMKGIEKPSSSSREQNIFLPQQVPYMIDLIAFFQSEQKLFLLLKQAEGGRLYDYIKTYKSTSNKTKNLAELFPEVDNRDVDSTVTRNISTESTDFNELVRHSQELLQTVSNTLSVDKKQVEQTRTLAAVEKGTLSVGPTIAKLPEACLKQWARELAIAIKSLHDKGVMLRDLNMENLLLGAKGQLLLTYFYQNENYKFVSDNYVHKSYSDAAIVGHYVAPERPLTFKSDWWSYGVVLYQLLMGLSFRATHPGNIELYGCVQYPEHIIISDSARDLLDNLLQQLPEERFDFDQVKAHVFFRGTKWDEVCRNGLNDSIEAVRLNLGT